MSFRRVGLDWWARFTFGGFWCVWGLDVGLWANVKCFKQKSNEQPEVNPTNLIRFRVNS